MSRCACVDFLHLLRALFLRLSNQSRLEMTHITWVHCMCRRIDHDSFALFVVRVPRGEGILVRQSSLALPWHMNNVES